MSKNKIIIYILMAIILGIVIGILVFNNMTYNEDIAKIYTEDEINNQLLIENNVNSSTTNSVTTNSDEEKVNINCDILLINKYLGCQHEITEYVNKENEYVNYTKDELEEEFSEYILEEFSDSKIVFYKQVDGICDEHYVIRNIDDTVVIYNITEDGAENIYQITDIDIKFLTQIDIEQLDEGIYVESKMSLNSILEDFE